MEKVLYLGGTHADIPLICRIKEMGMYVITVGLNENGLGHNYSDEYVKEDFSDNVRVLSLAKKYSVDYIIPSCSDFATLTASYVSNELGLPGYDPYETSQIIHNKSSFRQFCQRAKVTIPSIFTEINENNISKESYPLIIKPVDADSGKGISKVNNFKELSAAIEIAQTASRSKKVVVEQFITGSKHAASVIIKDKKIEFIFIDDEQYYLNKYMVAAASYPSKYIFEIVQPLNTELLKIIKELNLVDGLLHVQFILKEGLIYIIEACRRPPGEFYVKLVEYAKGEYYLNNIIKGYMGRVETYAPTNENKSCFIRQCVMADQNGIVENVQLANELKNNVLESIYWNGVGSEINNYLNEKIGVIFLKFESNATMQNAIENMSNLLSVKISKD